jgi:hypothetical protein
MQDDLDRPIGARMPDRMHDFQHIHSEGVDKKEAEYPPCKSRRQIHAKATRPKQVRAVVADLGGGSSEFFGAGSIVSAMVAGALWHCGWGPANSPVA